jgi:hypothetical protein
MAHRFGPAQGDADNKLGPRGRWTAIGSLRATFHHGPEPSAPRERPEIRLQSNPCAPPKGGQRNRSARRIRLTEESRYGLLGGEPVGTCGVAETSNLHSTEARVNRSVGTRYELRIQMCRELFR